MKTLAGSLIEKGVRKGVERGLIIDTQGRYIFNRDKVGLGSRRCRRKSKRNKR